MTMYDNAVAGVAPKKSNLIESLVARFQAWQEYRKTYNELASLTNRELDDIGINRGMIKSVAMEVYLDKRYGR